MELASWFFGITGFVLTLLFLGIVWYWMKYGAVEEGEMKTAANLKMLGYMFLISAVWFMCGVLGPPGSALRPEMVLKYGTLDTAIFTAYMLMVFLLVGFLLIFLGQRKACKARIKKCSE